MLRGSMRVSHRLPMRYATSQKDSRFYKGTLSSVIGFLNLATSARQPRSVSELVPSCYRYAHRLVQSILPIKQMVSVVASPAFALYTRTANSSGGGSIVNDQHWMRYLQVRPTEQSL